MIILTSKTSYFMKCNLAFHKVCWRKECKTPRAESGIEYIHVLGISASGLMGWGPKGPPPNKQGALLGLPELYLGLPELYLVPPKVLRAPSFLLCPGLFMLLLPER